MTVRLTEDKKNHIRDLCNEILIAQNNTIRDVAKLLGKFSSSFLGVPEGKLHFRFLERYKTKALSYFKGDFDKPIYLSVEAQEEVIWWRDHIFIREKNIFLLLPIPQKKDGEPVLLELIQGIYLL